MPDFPLQLVRAPFPPLAAHSRGSHGLSQLDTTTPVCDIYCPSLPSLRFTDSGCFHAAAMNLSYPPVTLSGSGIACRLPTVRAVALRFRLMAHLSCAKYLSTGRGPAPPGACITTYGSRRLQSADTLPLCRCGCTSTVRGITATKDYMMRSDTVRAAHRVPARDQHLGYRRASKSCTDNVVPFTHFHRK